MTEQNKEKTNNLVIGIPNYIKNAIDSHFANDYSPKDIAKIYFIIHKINRSGQYQLNNRNHSWMLGFRTDELSNILVKLQNLKLITKIRSHSFSEKAPQNNTSSLFGMYTPFNYNDNNIYRLNYYEGQCAFPIWVQKYLSDGGVVKSSKHSNYKKAAKVEKVDPKDEEIAKLKGEIAELNKLLDMAEAQLLKL